ncbi:acetyl-CoA synthetase (ADP-forming) [Desulfatibacillum alkenivorans DSM 16219]|jgi:acetyl-CoA synthetase (ADP-forming)|uniref:Acetyl-CoA synthetase (ADP-forming) n=1 Tax=Desulfatibacillum alkenivorans DSM 16219 TaxID=1121393 RepID=A0A1M6MRB5_9BACT|nr:acetate--CoA ligase family protein [Desulfatibacillum alkenivorans]SHJ85997.1 acetyl-CoA synthetase (ADP-forming) [Desulfatibacillum alkenivorans DSM 16219]
MKELIQKAMEKKQKALSEYESKLLIQKAGVPVPSQGLAKSRKEALQMAGEIGYPVVMKGCSDQATHKTEMGLVKLNIANEEEADRVYDELVAAGVPLDGVLVMPMVKADREFAVGLGRDPQFGPYVMFGLGGVLMEALDDVVFRIAPLTRFDAGEMIEEIRSKKLLGEFRGKPAVDKRALEDILISIGQIGLDHDEVAEIDINPLVTEGTNLFALDALVVLKSAD